MRKHTLFRTIKPASQPQTTNRYSPFSQMASIRDELKMSVEEEEEERKSNAILRKELIARTLRQRESTNEYLKALGEEPISYDSEITEHDWLLNLSETDHYGYPR
ncbi:uncharacterized protein LOC113323494 [Papaver somniferum]|uniref:uncharacterized protein LOC113323494 n=1 Tax=Papaver somniferum TaxID=3469 RepID=UPI000E6FE77D|nr:uncharacterized protein LOC113323494 [Papaver somniferum]